MSVPANFVFVHGSGQGSWAWAQVIEALQSQKYGAVGGALALDVPGCGEKRARDRAGLGPREIAAELIAEIDAAGLRDIVLVGHSMAGALLPIIVDRRPDLFCRVVYISASAPHPGSSILDYKEDIPVEQSGADPATLMRQLPLIESMRILLCNDLNAAEAEALLAQLDKDRWPEQMYGFRDWSYAGVGKVTATFIVCLRDAIAPVVWQKARAERLGASRVIEIDAGHQVLASRPQELAGLLMHEASAAALVSRR